MTAKADRVSKMLTNTFEVGDRVRSHLTPSFRYGRVVSCGVDENGDYVEVEWPSVAGTHYWYPRHLYLEDEE